MPLPQSYVDKWNKMRSMTTSIVNTIPEDTDYTWKPHSDMKSLGELISHIIFANYLVLNKFFLEQKLKVPEIISKGPHNKKSLFPFLDVTSTYVKELFNTLSASDLPQKLPKHNDWTAESVIRHLEDHEIHHSAQLKMYLKLLNIDTKEIKFCK